MASGLRREGSDEKAARTIADRLAARQVRFPEAEDCGIPISMLRGFRRKGFEFPGERVFSMWLEGHVLTRVAVDTCLVSFASARYNLLHLRRSSVSCRKPLQLGIGISSDVGDSPTIVRTTR